MKLIFELVHVVVVVEELNVPGAGVPMQPTKLIVTVFEFAVKPLEVQMVTLLK